MSTSLRTTTILSRSWSLTTLNAPAYIALGSSLLFTCFRANRAAKNTMVLVWGDGVGADIAALLRDEPLFDKYAPYVEFMSDRSHVK